MRRLSVLAALCYALAGPVAAQPPAGASPQPLTADHVRERIQAEGRITLGSSGILIERLDPGPDGLEAIVIRPPAPGPLPAIVLIPGYSRTAYDMLPVALRFAREGFATLAVSQPGFGASTGPADFAGPRTFAAVLAGAEAFSLQPYVDGRRLGVYGYSRGAIVAAQLASRTDLFRAAVFGGGIFDFASAYEEIQLPGIRMNMRAEAGDSPAAIRFRSPILDMEGLDGPVLIVHGAEDANAPPEQARQLDRRLTEIGREHELILVPGRGHALRVDDIVVPAAAFFRRHLGASQ